MCRVAVLRQWLSPAAAGAALSASATASASLTGSTKTMRPSLHTLHMECHFKFVALDGFVQTGEAAK